ncbi:flagellar type III secretion system pore protein FliP [Jeotgalibaca caeni]|uniref:flagellar type III secretion system pore protein FliP n=1 Tax=Jeotgalibaca caeni TaxID=3028623 RepID=UPI00237E1713|nr:flagellar type III secretion system pore protein FliP [Jeotgalibaca caeni]MDE1548271.1 flagellar type III secretion system pore protein FliP [Jeotgalibaca caeni]
MKRRIQQIGWTLFLFFLTAQPVQAAELENVWSDVGSADTVQLYLVLGLLSVIPAFLILTTSFTRIIVILSFLRSSLGTQQNPPNQVLVGLALFLTFFIMQPVYTEVYEDAISPLVEEEISLETSLSRAETPIKDFMLDQTREKDLQLFLDLSGQEAEVSERRELPLTVVIPAFAISELRTAFTVGFLLFIPFLIIDMVVASILMSMGMFMLSPAMISLPFKLLLFVLVDGWYLVVESVVLGFYS